MRFAETAAGPSEMSITFGGHRSHPGSEAVLHQERGGDAESDERKHQTVGAALETAADTVPGFDKDKLVVKLWATRGPSSARTEAA